MFFNYGGGVQGKGPSGPYLLPQGGSSTAPPKSSSVFLVTSGDGSDGDEWHVWGIFTNKHNANLIAEQLSKSRCTQCSVEEWELNKVTD